MSSIQMNIVTLKNSDSSPELHELGDLKMHLSQSRECKVMLMSLHQVMWPLLQTLEGTDLSFLSS